MTPEPRAALDAASAAVQATPSVAAVVATKVLDIQVDTVLGLCGIAFIALQAAHLIWKWRRDIRMEESRELAQVPDDSD